MVRSLYLALAACLLCLLGAACEAARPVHLGQGLGGGGSAPTSGTGGGDAGAGTGTGGDASDAGADGG